MQVESTRLVAQDDALRVRSCSTQRYGITRAPGEVASLSDRADKRGSKVIEDSGGND